MNVKQGAGDHSGTLSFTVLAEYEGRLQQGTDVRELRDGSETICAGTDRSAPVRIGQRQSAVVQLRPEAIGWQV